MRMSCLLWKCFRMTAQFCLVGTDAKNRHFEKAGCLTRHRINPCCVAELSQVCSEQNRMAWFPKHFLGKGASVKATFANKTLVPSVLSWGIGSALCEAEGWSTVNL